MSESEWVSEWAQAQSWVEAIVEAATAIEAEAVDNLVTVLRSIA